MLLPAWGCAEADPVEEGSARDAAVVEQVVRELAGRPPEPDALPVVFVMGVDGTIGMVLHAPVTSDETLHYREDRPLLADDETTEGAVDLRDDATVYDTFSRGDEAVVEIRQIEDPTLIERSWHWARLNVPLLSIGIGVPSLPAPIAVGGGPLVVLAGGAIVARRIQP